MARKIRFPLVMGNGVEVRTLEELRENFDLEAALGYLIDGKLLIWAEDRYYDELAVDISKLSIDSDNVKEELCRVIGVEYEANNNSADIYIVKNRELKLRTLREITDDETIIDNIDIVATNQQELNQILEISSIVYLFGDEFIIPSEKTNISYIGINTPLVSLEEDIYYYFKNSIDLKNVKINENNNVSEYNRAVGLFIHGEFESAFNIIAKYAENENPRAMYILSLYYEYGFGCVKIDEQKTRDLLEKGTEYKEPLSIIRKLYKYGEKKEWENINTECIRAIEIQSKISDILAIYELGRSYTLGVCVVKDYEKAFSLYKMASDYGYVLAYDSIGYMYDWGYGVEQNKDLAIQWREKSALKNNALSQEVVASMYSRKDSQKSIEYVIKSAEQGRDESKLLYASFFRSGIGVEKNVDKAIEMYRMYFEEEGIAKAAREIGRIYNDMEKSNVAIEWFKKGMDAGDLHCICEIGYTYYALLDNPDKAIEWLKIGVDKGYASAYLQIGSAYMKKKYYKSAREWFIKAKEKGIDVGNSMHFLDYYVETIRNYPDFAQKAGYGTHWNLNK